VAQTESRFSERSLKCQYLSRIESFTGFDLLTYGVGTRPGVPCRSWGEESWNRSSIACIAFHEWHARSGGVKRFIRCSPIGLAPRGVRLGRTGSGESVDEVVKALHLRVGKLDPPRNHVPTGQRSPHGDHLPDRRVALTRQPGVRTDGSSRSRVYSSKHHVPAKHGEKAGGRRRRHSQQFHGPYGEVAPSNG